MRAILPPAGNEVIGQLKTTAVVSVISLQDVLFSAQIIYQRTYEVIPLLLVATLWYLLLTSLLSVIQYYVERHFSRSSHRKVKRKATKTVGIRRGQHRQYQRRRNQPWVKPLNFAKSLSVSPVIPFWMKSASIFRPVRSR
jgi:hypothetical protein